jgi:hypothetical protein
MPRGQSAFFQVWLSSENIDLSAANMYIGSKAGTAEATNLLYTLDNGSTAIQLDSEDASAYAALEAAPSLKLESAGDPGNTGSDRKKVTFEAKVSGLQTTSDLAAVTALIALDGDRLNIYYIDVTLGLVRKALNVPVTFEADNTGNAPDIKTLKGENMGDIADIWQEANLPLTDPDP